MKVYKDILAYEEEELVGLQGYRLFLREYWMDLVKLNLLFVIGSLLIVTIPASVTAMCRIIAAMLHREKYALVRDFFSTWKKEFGPSLAIGIFTGLGMGIGIFGFLVAHEGGLIGDSAGNIARAVCVVLFFASLDVGIYAFPMKARLELGVAEILKNSILLLFIELKKNLLADVFVLVLMALLVLGFPFDLPLFFVGAVTILSFTVSYMTRSGLQACSG